MSKKYQLKSKIYPPKLAAGDSLEIQCEFSGTLHAGFFDLVLLGPGRRPSVWMPDRSTWNSYRDTGILKGTRVFSTRWKHFIPDWIPQGEYSFLVQVYDDKKGKHPRNRKPIAQEKHTVSILPSRHPEAVFVRNMYGRFLKRKPDISGYHTWFANLQIQKATRRQVLEIGFLRSREFRARFIHKLLLQEDIEPNELERSVIFLRKSAFPDFILEKYPEEISSRPHMLTLLKTELKLGTRAENSGIEELKKLDKTTKTNELLLVYVIENFLLEKYILINCLYPDLSPKETGEKVMRYLSHPEEIVNEFARTS